jgi:hypothetical protein
MTRCQFVYLTCRLLYRAMMEAAIALGVSCMLDPMFTGRDCIKILIRNKNAFADMTEIAMKNRVERVWTHRYSIEGNAKGTHTEEERRALSDARDSV